jgi:hypothetical protein
METSAHDVKVAWLEGWCSAHGLVLELEGEVGFGRECVGVMAPDPFGGAYVDFDTYDPATFDPLPFQEGLIPGAEAPDAYHKHDCLCVLGRGPEAEAQLYAWVRRLADAGALIEKGVPKTGPPDLGSLVGITTRTRIVLPTEGGTTR